MWDFQNVDVVVNTLNRELAVDRGPDISYQGRITLWPCGSGR